MISKSQVFEQKKEKNLLLIKQMHIINVVMVVNLSVANPI